MKKDHQTDRGIATIELLIALAVGVVMLTGAVLVSFGGQTAGLDTGLTRTGLSRAFDYFGQNVAAVAGATDWNSPDLIDDEDYDSDTFYTHTAMSEEIFPCVWLVKGDVTWTSEQSRGFETQLETLLGNVEEAKKRDDCGSPFGGGDWDNPTTYGSAPPQVVDGQGTGIAVTRIDGRNYAFITTHHNDSKKHDLWSFDVTDPQGNQPLLDSINIASSSAAVVIAEDQTSGKHYAYIAGYSIDKSGSCNDAHEKQFQVVDISEPKQLKLVASEDLSTIDPCGSYPAGHSIAYYDGKVYVGTKETKGEELTVFDVSLPESPSELGNISVERSVNDILVRNGLAYVAVGEGTVPPYTPFRIYDLGTQQMLDAFSNGVNTQQGTSIYVLGSKAFLGLESGSGDEFRILNIADPNNITELGSMRLGLKANKGKNTEVSGISVRGNLAFLSTTDPNSPFYVLDISDLNDIDVVSNCIPYNYSQATQDLVYFDNFIFVVDRSQAALRVIYDQPSMCQK